MKSTIGELTDGVVAALPSMGDVKSAVENEILLMAVFDVVDKFSLLPDDAVFLGGTALRLCYGSPRFSEDLDFHTPTFAPRLLDRETLGREVGAVLDCEVSVSTPMSPTTSTLARISAALPERRRDERRPRTKIDLGAGRSVDARPTIVTLKVAGGTMPGMGVVGDPFSYMVASKEEILADKHLALVGRARRIKNRDLFDLMWLHHQGVAFRPDMLHAKLDTKRRTSFVGLLRQRAKDAEDAISSRAYEAEMRTFLPRGSTWLFDDSHRRDGMAKGLRSMVMDNAEALDRILGRKVVTVDAGLRR